MKPDFTYYFLRWLTGFCEVVDGVLTVCTLGFFNPNATFAMVCYTSKRNINRMMEARRDGKA